MTRPADRVMTRIAAHLDLMKSAVPAGYEANVILVNTADPEAHIFVGSSDPRKVADALSELIDNPGRCGIANADGIRIDL